MSDFFSFTIRDLQLLIGLSILLLPLLCLLTVLRFLEDRQYRKELRRHHR